jgi:hypothetical protein
MIILLEIKCKSGRAAHNPLAILPLNLFVTRHRNTEKNAWHTGLGKCADIWRSSPYDTRKKSRRDLHTFKIKSLLISGAYTFLTGQSNHAAFINQLFPEVRILAGRFGHAFGMR